MQKKKFFDTIFECKVVMLLHRANAHSKRLGEKIKPKEWLTGVGCLYKNRKNKLLHFLSFFVENVDVFEMSTTMRELTT